MCRLCEIKAESSSSVGPIPEDVPALVRFFAEEQGWDWDVHSLDENIQWAVQALFMEGMVAIATSWAPSRGVRYHSKYDHQEEISISIIPLESLENIDPEEFMTLAGKDTNASIEYLVEKLGLQGKVDTENIVGLMKDYGLEVVSPEADFADGELS